MRHIICLSYHLSVKPPVCQTTCLSTVCHITCLSAVAVYHVSVVAANIMTKNKIILNQALGTGNYHIANRRAILLVIRLKLRPFSVCEQTGRVRMAVIVVLTMVVALTTEERHQTHPNDSEGDTQHLDQSNSLSQQRH